MTRAEQILGLVAVDNGVDLDPTPPSWAGIDLTSYLDGTHLPCQPTLLRRSDGPHLLYPGRVHWLAGEPEALKSWLALLACLQVLDQGGRVVFIDFEDGPAGIVGRLLALGVDRQVIASRFDYRSPEGALRRAERDALAGDVAAADLLVIDACTEALAAQGLSSKDDVDVASWLALLPRWAARLGPAVLVLDHVVKDSENRGRWATGSQHKLAGLDGVALTLEAVQPGGVGMVGRSRLYCSKDRHGQVRPHSVPSTGGRAWLGDLVVDSSGPFTEAVLHPPTAQEGTFVPTVVMGKVSDVLSAAGRPLSKSEVEDRVGGRAAVVRQAIAALQDAGHIEVTTGSHNSRQHRLLKAYPEGGGAAMNTPSSSARPARPQFVPDEPQCVRPRLQDGDELTAPLRQSVRPRPETPGAGPAPTASPAADTHDDLQAGGGAAEPRARRAVPPDAPASALTDEEWADEWTAT